jgi:hypothetical protein
VRTNYSIPAALGYLNDSLNVRYCRPGDEYGTTLVFIDTFEVAVNGSNQITDTDLEDLADEIADTAGAHFYGRGAGSKAPFMFEIRQAGAVDGGMLPVSSWFIMEEGEPTDESDAYPYEESWPYGHGQIIGCPTTPNGIDAPDLFRRDLRKEIVYGLKNGKGMYAYNRLYTICFSAMSDDCVSYEIPFLSADEFQQDLDNPDDPQNNDNFYEKPLFYNHSQYSNYHECLSPSEMNFHYDEMKELAEDQVGEGSVGERDIVQLEVGYNELFTGTSRIFHSMQVYYANIIQATSGVSQLPDVNP